MNQLVKKITRRSMMKVTTCCSPLDILHYCIRADLLKFLMEQQKIMHINHWHNHINHKLSSQFQSFKWYTCKSCRSNETDFRQRLIGSKWIETDNCGIKCKGRQFPRPEPTSAPALPLSIFTSAPLNCCNFTYKMYKKVCLTC